MSQDTFLEETESFIASCYDVFTSVQGFHWNVEGDGFFHLHEFFKQAYEELHSQVDDFAERVRTFDRYAPGTLFEMKQLSKIKTPQGRKHTAEKMLEIFCENTTILVNQAKQLIKLCDDVNDFVTQDMLIEFVHGQEKNLWMARSYMKK